MRGVQLTRSPMMSMRSRWAPVRLPTLTLVLMLVETSAVAPIRIGRLSGIMVNENSWLMASRIGSPT